MANDYDRLFDRKQAASFLTERGYRTAVATLAKLACIGGGPTFESFGRRPLYRETDLLAWAQARTTGPRRSTSDPGTGSSGREAGLRERGALPTGEIYPAAHSAISERLDPWRARVTQADPEIREPLPAAVGELS